MSSKEILWQLHLLITPKIYVVIRHNQLNFKFIFVYCNKAIRIFKQRLLSQFKYVLRVWQNLNDALYIHTHIDKYTHTLCWCIKRVRGESRHSKYRAVMTRVWWEGALWRLKGGWLWRWGVIIQILSRWVDVFLNYKHLSIRSPLIFKQGHSLPI